MSSIIKQKEKILNLDTDTIKTESQIPEYNTITICYDKKWYILLGFVILGIIFYLYYYNISIILPLASLVPKRKKKKYESDSESDLEDGDDDWDIENEIDEYMKKQYDYINK